MKEIYLTQGFIALVDNADFDAVNALSWFAMKNGRHICAGRNLRRADGSRTTLLMHKFLMPGVEKIDHRDGCALNNQRYNLRPASTRQNQQAFRHKKLNASSEFRGVRRLQGGKWDARIRVNGVLKYLGLFEIEKDAALEYDKAAREFFGEFAAPNFPVSCRE